MNAVMIAAAAAESGSGGGAGLGLLLLVGLVAFLLRGSGTSWARWEYTRPDGHQAFTEWYDADTHYLWEDPQDPTHFEIRPRGES